jgi:solute carrier family 30 (zinc transporter), member 2
MPAESEEWKDCQGKEKKTEMRNINEQAAYLHILGDLLNSAGVVIASVCIYINPNLYWLDPTCCCLFAVIVLSTSIGTFKRQVQCLMEATPEDFDQTALQSAFKNTDGVEAVHELRVWSLSQGKNTMTVHIECK